METRDFFTVELSTVTFNKIFWLSDSCLVEETWRVDFGVTLHCEYFPVYWIKYMSYSHR